MDKNKTKKSLVSNDISNNLRGSVFAKGKPTETKKIIEPVENKPINENNELTKEVAPQNGTTAPAAGTTAPQLELDKLETIVQELSQVPARRDGLNVRLSEQEITDIEEFIHGKLRKKGLKGYDVSAAKLMRYAFRYLSRVHEKEFIETLENALKIDKDLTI